MGKVATKICGGDDTLKMLLQQYGEDINKLVVIEHAKKFLRSNQLKISHELERECDKIEEETLKEIEMKERQMEKEYEGYKASLSKRVPGGIKSLQKIKEKPVEQMLDVEFGQKKFEDLRRNTQIRFDEEEQKVKEEIKSVIQLEGEELKKRRPNIPMYEQLQENAKIKVLKEGSAKCKEEIDDMENEIRKNLEEKCSVQGYLVRFKEIVPTSSLEAIFLNTTSVFQRNYQLLCQEGISKQFF